jgi:hypothetical protein
MPQASGQVNDLWKVMTTAKAAEKRVSASASVDSDMQAVCHIALIGRDTGPHKRFHDFRR